MQRAAINCSSELYQRRTGTPLEASDDADDDVLVLPGGTVPSSFLGCTWRMKSPYCLHIENEKHKSKSQWAENRTGFFSEYSVTCTTSSHLDSWVHSFGKADFACQEPWFLDGGWEQTVWSHEGITLNATPLKVCHWLRFMWSNIYSRNKCVVNYLNVHSLHNYWSLSTLIDEY